MSNIYDQHKAAFSNVSAYVILKDGERVATVAIKYPSRGEGRLWAYLHVIGLPMVRSYAAGCGYDKRSAAVASAARKVEASKGEYATAEDATLAQFWNDLSPSLDKGHEWTRALELAGFTVLQAV